MLANWDGVSERQLGRTECADAVIAVSCRTQGATLFGCKDGSVWEWGRQGGKAARLLAGQGPVLALSFSPDSAAVAKADPTGCVRVYDTAKAERLSEWKHPAAVPALAFAGAGGKVVVTGCADGKVRVWDVPENCQTQVYDCRSPVTAVAASGDGRVVVSGGQDGVVRVWTVGEAEPLALKHGNRKVTSLAIDRAAAMLLSGGEDGAVRAWNVTKGQPIGSPLRLGREVTAVGFSPDEKVLLAGGADGALRSWPAPQPLSGAAEDIILWAQIESGMELDLQGRLNTLSAEEVARRKRVLAERLGGHAVGPQ